MENIMFDFKKFLSCASCLKFKKFEDLGFFRECGHFYCLSCVDPNKSFQCSSCFHFGSLVWVADDPSTCNLISLICQITGAKIDSDALTNKNASPDNGARNYETVPEALNSIREFRTDENSAPLQPDHDLACSVVPETQFDVHKQKKKPRTRNEVKRELPDKKSREQQPLKEDNHSAGDKVDRVTDRAVQNPVVLPEDTDIFFEDSPVKTMEKFKGRKRKRENSSGSIANLFQDATPIKEPERLSALVEEELEGGETPFRERHCTAIPKLTISQDSKNDEENITPPSMNPPKIQEEIEQNKDMARVKACRVVIGQGEKMNIQIDDRSTTDGLKIGNHSPPRQEVKQPARKRSRKNGKTVDNFMEADNHDAKQSQSSTHSLGPPQLRRRRSTSVFQASPEPVARSGDVLPKPNSTPIRTRKNSLLGKDNRHDIDDRVENDTLTSIRKAKATPRSTRKSSGSSKPAAKTKTPVQASSARKLNSPSLHNTPKRNARGETPLHDAIKKNNFIAVKTLLENKLDPNVQDYAGWTPLHDGVHKGYLAIVSCLLEHGAVVDACGLNNETPLHKAVVMQNLLMVRLLLQHGADPNARDIFGNTPMSLAEGTEFSTVLRLEGRPGKVVPVPAPLSCHTVTLYILSEEQSVIQDTYKFSALFSIPVEKTNFYKATHVVVPEGTPVDSFNWSLVRAIAKGTVLVSPKWFEISTKTGKLDIPEDCKVLPDWMPGLTRSQKNAQLRRPGLLSGFSVTMGTHGNSVPSYPLRQGHIRPKELQVFVEQAGAKLLHRVPDPECPLQRPTIPYHAEPGPLEKCSQMVIYFPGYWEPAIKYNMAHLKCLPVQWLIDCVLNFQLISNLEPYFVLHRS